MALVAIQFSWPSTENYEQAKDLGTLAQAIWGRYVLPVELIGLALLTAMIGGVALLRREKIESIAAYREEPVLIEETPGGEPLSPTEEANPRSETP